MKKILCAIFAVLLFVSAVPAGADGYWDAQARYKEAVDSGDPEKIISAVKAIEAVYPNPKDQTERNRLMEPLKKAAQAYESLGKFPDAGVYYKKYLKLVKASITDDDPLKYQDAVNTATMLAEHNSVTPTVYAATSSVSNIPNLKAKNEPRAGTYHGMCGVYDETRDNALLLYVHFFNETIEGFSWKLPDTENRYVLTVAWNSPNENLADLQKVANGEADDYIIENLEYVAGLNADVMIRLFAEVNTWSDLPQKADAYLSNGKTYTETYIKAFRRVADLVHRYAPNAAMVFSPNDISNWFFRPEDFYPGDKYVDWIGISCYCNLSSSAANKLSSGNDAYYCRGLYENEIVKIGHIVDTFGSKKPIMVSECGFCYKNNAGTQTEAHALKAMKQFFSYVTMVYPQVKCVNYFNTNHSGNCYCLFNNGSAAGNANLAELYTSLITSDPAMEYSMGRTDKCGYTKVYHINEVTGSLDLSTYAWYPGGDDLTVTYSLDTEKVSSSKQIPYSCSLDMKELAVGNHLLTVKVTCKKTSKVLLYLVNKDVDGKVRVTKAYPDAIKDMKESNWAYECVGYGLGTGLFTGMSDTQFAPNVSLSRAMFVTIMGRMAGVDTSKYNYSSFDDVKKGKWYTPYIAWAKETGVVKGLSETKFGPDALITREQMCAILTRYADYFEIGLPGGSGGSKFADDSKISNYAKTAVYRAKNAGLVNGKGNNMFEPRATATRAEAAAIIMRFCFLQMNG